VGVMARIWLGIATLALATVLSGCGAGQQTQTANQVPASGGAAGSVGSIQVRDAHFQWNGPVPAGAVYRPGDDAPLQVTIVNNATSILPDGFTPDRLVAVSSPVATSGRIVGDARIPDGQVLTAGYDQPLAAVVLPGTREVEITLVGLTEPVRAGVSYPVVFTFERAGDLRVDVPVENPRVLPPRARDAQPGHLPAAEPGADSAAAPG
jgi:hypothetical protein